MTPVDLLNDAFQRVLQTATDAVDGLNPGRAQVWTEHGFADRFDLPFDEASIGYGQTSDEVGQVHVEADLLADYLRAVHEQTMSYLATLTADDLDRVIDTRWDPPVTLAVRLVSVVSDDLQHAGQAAYVRGLLGV